MVVVVVVTIMEERERERRGDNDDEMMCRPGDSRASGIQVDATSIADADADGLRRVARHHCIDSP